jgi:hypothetical protein
MVKYAWQVILGHGYKVKTFFFRRYWYSSNFKSTSAPSKSWYFVCLSLYIRTCHETSRSSAYLMRILCGEY